MTRATTTEQFLAKHVQRGNKPWAHTNKLRNSHAADSFPPFHVSVQVSACTTHCSTSVSHICNSQLEADCRNMNSTGGGNVGKSEERLLDDGVEGEGKRRGWIELEGTAKKTTRAHTHTGEGEINGTIFTESRSFFLRGCGVVHQSQTAEWIILWEWKWIMRERVSGLEWMGFHCAESKISNTECSRTRVNATAFLHESDFSYVWL